MSAFKQPNRSSWIDAITQWVDAAPIPNWLAYVGGYMAVAFIWHVAAWLDRAAAVPHLRVDLLFSAVWSVMPLILLHHLTALGGRSVDRLVPAVTNRSDELAALRSRMSTTPWWTVTALSVLALGLALSQVLGSPDDVYPGLAHPASSALAAVVLSFSFSCAFTLVFQGVRELLGVRSAYALVGRVDVFRPRALYAFSGLTLQAGLFWLLLANLDLVASTNGFRDGLDAASVMAAAPFLLLAPLTFLTPLLGIHGRLREARNAALDENGRLIGEYQRSLYRSLASADHDEVERWDRGLSSLYRVRDEVHKAPTWPWEPSTLGTFLTAVFVPMLVWLLQAVGAKAL